MIGRISDSDTNLFDLIEMLCGVSSVNWADEMAYLTGASETSCEVTCRLWLCMIVCVMLGVYRLDVSRLFEVEIRQVALCREYQMDKSKLYPKIAVLSKIWAILVRKK